MDSVEGGGPRLVYNPDDGSIELRLGGPALTVEGLAEELAFERMTEAGDSAAPLWIEPNEAAVLAKMVRYVLDKVTITEASRQTLLGLLPRIEQLNHGAGTDPGGA